MRNYSVSQNLLIFLKEKPGGNQTTIEDETGVANLDKQGDIFYKGRNSRQAIARSFALINHGPYPCSLPSIYSDLRLFTGFVRAALMACTLIVSSVMQTTDAPVTRKTSAPIFVR